MEKGFLLFPGQGAQCIGMARDVYAEGGHAVALFDEASEILGFDLPELVFNGTDEDLAKTENCQPALLVSCLALMSTLRERGVFSFTGAAGLSLGEYTALVALESIDFADAVRLVRRRGQLMESSGRGLDTGMASVIGLDFPVVEKICSEVSALGCGLVVPANYNSPGQLVISGEKSALSKAAEKLKEAGARRVLSLNVSAAFHSPFMQEAQQGLREALLNINISKPKGMFINNAQAEVLSDPEEIRSSLINQLVSPVKWEQSCRLMTKNGEALFYEIGPGKVCSGLMKRISPEAKVINISSLADIDAVI